LGTADREHDLIEPVEIADADAPAELYGQARARVDCGRIEVEQRAPARAVRRGRSNGELAADRIALVEEHHRPRARQRRRTLEPGRAGADNRDATAIGRRSLPDDERRSRTARFARRPELRVDRAQER